MINIFNSLNLAGIASPTVEEPSLPLISTDGAEQAFWAVLLDISQHSSGIPLTPLEQALVPDGSEAVALVSAQSLPLAEQQLQMLPTRGQVFAAHSLPTTPAKMGLRVQTSGAAAPSPSLSNDLDAPAPILQNNRLLTPIFEGAEVAARFAERESAPSASTIASDQSPTATRGADGRLALFSHAQTMAGELIAARRPTQQLAPLEVRLPVAEQLVARVGFLLSNNLNQANIAISPPELGPLEVKVQMSGDQFGVSFSVAHAATRDLIEDALPRLREHFEQAGLALGDTDVSDRGPNENDAAPASTSSPSQASSPEPEEEGLTELPVIGLLNVYV
ncbi:MAG: flagellar hook-length control protein FliK [Pseudomonadota bacterium]